MHKLEQLGCPRSVLGLVTPSGYSFNLDGTNIYLTMAALFVAQALNIELSLTQQLTLLLVAMLTSKAASAVTDAGFITLAATLACCTDGAGCHIVSDLGHRPIHVRSTGDHQHDR
ncbi:C4-dicarboxylate transport protein [Methylococcales bacterium]|nr:C4-dicarboxylate transport protein [Methylococcales bacterium]